MEMKRYEGTKRLLAVAMTLGAYNAYRGWTLTTDEDPDKPGYLVEYEDGGQANDSRHKGYISWSPADVFERAYNPIAADEPDKFLQPKITGYRQLSAHETDLMNRVKAMGENLEQMMDAIRQAHLIGRGKHPSFPCDVSAEEIARLDDAEPERWLAMGRTDIQVGIMKICRAIAQPRTRNPG